MVSGQSSVLVGDRALHTHLSFTIHRDRVLCVFTTGQAWQFKGYKWEDPKELFRNGEP